MLARTRFLLPLLEAALITLFFTQALRYLVGALYARIGSASLYPAINPALADSALPGLVEPSAVTNEITFLVYMLILPVLALFIGGFRTAMLVPVITVAVGRYLMNGSAISPVIGAAIVLGGGLLYFAMLIRHRAQTLPYALAFGLAVDQIFRASGDTVDPSWFTDYANIQLVLSAVTVLLALFNLIQRPQQESGVNLNHGLMPFWGGIAFGAVLFLELSLLSLPNAAAGRANASYNLMVPLMMAATLLPTIPWVRGRARAFIALFDSGVRGWSWMLIIMLCIVFGTRLQVLFTGSVQALISAIALAVAQFCTVLVFWWLARPQAQKERNFSGLWLVFGMVVFALLVTFDIFTYEYAFVRNFAPELDFLNPIIPPLLRGFRGLGLAVLLLTVFLVTMPMVQMRRRIAWNSATGAQSLLALLALVGFTTGAVLASQPPVVQGVIEPERIRVGTYNMHAGYNEFFNFDIEAIARTIQQSGADVVLLQEVEAGRLTSFGVDQPFWLARRLRMDRRFYPTNEGLQGLAVLSRIEIVFDDGELLNSITNQTGLQRVQVRPDTGVITLYNTWLEPLLAATNTDNTTSDLEAGQRAQLNQILGIIGSHHPNGQLGRTVIGGTFNNIPDSPLIRQIIELGFVDHFVDLPLERTVTYRRTGAQARLDYLWTTNNLRVIARDVIDTAASDHRMVVVEIQLR
ncbi:MAG: hypothetical protein OHK0046_27350 [Anaerolineae bacterium]